MVIRKNLKYKFALISVYNKNGLKRLCGDLVKYNYKFISTGSTAKKIKSYGFDCLEISKITKFKEILNGRVKTLNPKIYGSILFRRENDKHLKEFNNLNFPKIDLVVVNLYPFSKFKNTNDINKTIEMIDIGGPSLLRAASKNYEHVTPIAELSDYKSLIVNIKKNKGLTDIIFRKKMAGRIFKLTSNYDNQINKWFENNKKVKREKIKMRYGENPNQKAFFLPKSKNSLFNYQIHGKKISYNNIIDVDSGYKCLTEFKKPTCVIIKHTNPCGVASANSINIAFQKAFGCDTKSAFGGIILLNRGVDKNFANFVSKYFFEIIVATDFTKAALSILKRKRNLILIKIKNIKINSKEYKETIFGEIQQEVNNKLINKNFIKLVSEKKPSNKVIDDLIFSLKVVKHMKSNAIVLSKDNQTIGLGSGQTNRIDALKSAIKQMKKNSNSKNFVCASDGFFPFNDSISLLSRNNCSVIAQPSGSLNDKSSIKFAVKNKISLYFTKFRLFKH